MLDRETYLAKLAVFRASAAVVIRDGGGKVLVVEPTYKPRWELPGGAVDPGESPRTAVIREIGEELGLELSVGRVLVVDQTQPSDRTPVAMLHFLFEGPTLGPADAGRIRLPPAELAAFRFVDARDAQQMVGARIGPRLRHALAAADTGTAYYLEDGQVLDGTVSHWHGRRRHG